MVDAPCGAMVWMPLVLEKLAARIGPCFRYTGLDVVRPVIATNEKTFATLPFMDFGVVDFAEEALTGGPHDLIFCRDALQHLNMRLILKALARFTEYLHGSPSRYFLVGSYKNGRNKNIETGEYFHIDLRLPPFSMTPYEVFDEVVGERDYPKVLLLFRGDYLRTLDFAAMTANATGSGMLPPRRK
jgi:hypothetical protein